MAAKRRSAKGRKPQPEQKDKNPADIFQEAIEAQIGLWKEWGDRTNNDVRDAAKEIAPIVAEHWAKMFEVIWRSASETPRHVDPIASQNEMRRYLLVSYNDMMKKVLKTKSFATKSSKSVKEMLQTTKAWNDAMEETLKMMRLPTKGDIDDIHEALYNLNKRVDELRRSIPSKNQRGRSTL